MKVKKGECFRCLREGYRVGRTIFRVGEIYVSEQDGYITDDTGTCLKVTAGGFWRARFEKLPGKAPEGTPEKSGRGDLEGFPLDVVAAMLTRQEEQTGKKDISVFKEDISVDDTQGGFRWDNTVEGFHFWAEVIVNRNWELFRRWFGKPGYEGDEGAKEDTATPEIPEIPSPQTEPGLTEERVKAIAFKVALETYDEREKQQPLNERLKELGFYPQPITVEVKAPEKETKKVENQHFLFPTILKALVARVNIALVGPAGSGKTSLVHNAANALDLPFYSKSVSAQTGVHEFFGYQDANGNFVRTLFREAYENGGVFLVDEFDAGNPNVLAALNQATANGSCAFPDRMVDKHTDFIVVMAGNTYGTGATAEYVGRNKIDAATLDRFVFVQVPYDETLETALATNKDWCRKVQGFRARAEKKKVKCIISPRATFNGEALLAAGVEEDFVLQSVIFKGLSEDEIQLLTEKDSEVKASDEATRLSKFEAYDALIERVSGKAREWGWQP